ncbi:MAG: hypothetical protein SFW66_04150 [Gammaproteobacteria bacterium]|nr:hypothetical protein [Gammaproteobacteria bacterium]
MKTFAESSKRNNLYQQGSFLKALCLISRAMLLGFLYTSVVFANPEGAQVVSGQVNISSTPNTVEIQQSSDKAIINWHSFNIGENEKTHFQQPSANSIALNRIDPNQGISKILGTLSANGQVWLMNSAGIYFGANAHIDVAGLLATTANILDQDFLNGNYQFFNLNSLHGVILNEGIITILEGGVAALVGYNVSNDGLIQARLGKVTLAAGESYTLDFAGTQLVQFAIGSEVSELATDANGKKLKAAVSNDGRIIADGGSVSMTAKTAQSILDHAVNMKGYIQADTIQNKNGEIILVASNGTTEVSGTVVARGNNHNEKGGHVKILGEKVIVKNNAEINTSGNAGGGEILLGGDYQGKNPDIQNAQFTFLGSGVNLYADALTNGDGGKIILWANEGTYFYGNIFARGGSQLGNGGFVETSGKGYLEAFGMVYASALHGTSGSWLLDPANVTISSGATTNGSFDGGSPNNQFTTTANNAIANVGTINASLDADTNVIILTSPGGSQAGTITVSNAILKSAGGSNVTLTLSADSTIAINSTIGFSSGGLNVALFSSGAITQTAAITASSLTVNAGAGAVTLTNASNSVSGAVSITNTGANAVSYTNSGALTIGTTSVGQNLTFTATGAITQSGIITASGGTTTLAAGSGNDITLSNASNNFSTIAITTGNNVTIQDTNALVLGASTVSGNYSVTTGGAITQSGAQTVTGTSSFTAGASAITLTTATNAFTGAVTLSNSGANNVSLTNNIALSLAASSVGQNLTIVTSSDAITQTGALTVPGTSSFTAVANSITLTNASNSFTGAITLSNSGANDVSVTNTLATVLAASTIGRNITLISGGNITQTGAITATGGTTTSITVNAANSDVLLNTQANNFGSAAITFAGTLSNFRDIGLRNTNASAVLPTNLTSLTSLRSLTITFNAAAVALPGLTLQSGGNLSVTAGAAGGITQSGALTVPGTSSFTAGANPITLTSTNSFTGVITLSNSGTNDVSLTNTIATSLAASTVGGNYSVTSGGAITQTGAQTVTGTASFSAGSNAITLTTATNAFTGAVTLSNSGANNVSLTNNIALSLAASSVGQNLTIITSSDAITQTGALTVPGTSSFTAVANSITLTNASNSFTGAITLSNSGANDISLTNSLATVLATSTIGRNITLISGGSITQTGAITATGGTAATSITVNAANSDVLLNTSANNFGSTAITFTGTLGNFRDIGLRNTNASAAVPTNLASLSSLRNLTLVFNAAAITLPSLTLSGSLSVTAGGAITQSGAIIGATLTAKTLLTAGAAITLTNSSNDFATVNLSARNTGDTANAPGAISYTDLNGFDVSGIATTSTVTLTGGDAITQSGAIAGTTLTAKTLNNVGAAITLTTTTNAVTTINLSARDATDISNVAGAISYRDTDGVAIAGINTASTASVIAGNVVTQTGAILASALAVKTLNNTAASTNITLSNSGNDVTSIDLRARNAADSADIGGAISYVDATGVDIVAIGTTATLSITTSGSITQSGAISATGTDTFAAGSANDITLTGANNFGTISITNGNNVSFNDTNALVLGAATISGNYTVTLAGALTQTAAQAVTGTSSFTVGANTITLTNTSNSFTGAVSLSNSGANAVSLTNNGNLILGTLGLGSAAITLSSNSAGTITETGSITASGTTTFIAGAANDITLTGSNDFGTVAVTSGNNVSLNDINALILGASTVSGNYSVTTSGALTQSAALTVTGTSSFTAGANAITLATATNAFTGAVTLSNSGANNVALTNNIALSLAASTVGQNLTIITSSDAITQTGALTVPGTSSFTAVANTITLTNASNSFTGAIALSNSGVNNASVTNSIATSLAASTVGGALTITSSGALTQTGALTITGASNFSAGSNAITLTTATNAFTGAVTLSNSGANDVSLTNNIALSLATSTVGQNLTIITSSDAITQTGALTVPGTSSFTAVANTITLTNTSNSFAGAVSLSNSGANAVSLTNNGNLILGTLSLGTAAVTLSSNSAGTITETGTTTASGTTTFIAGSGNDITLTGLNNFGTVSITSGNNVSLNDINTLVLGAATVSGNYIVTMTGALTQTGAVSVAGNSNFSVGAGAITLTNTSNSFTGAVSLSNSGANAVSLTNNGNLILGTLGLGSAAVTLSSNSAGTITETGTITASGATTLIAGAANDITLTGSNDFGTVVVTSGKNVSLNDINALVLGAATISGTYGVTTSGAITQSGTLTITGASTFSAGSANNITLSTGTNNFSTVSISSGNNVALTDANSVILGASTVSGTLGVTTTGTITQSGALSVTGTTTLAAGAANDITLTNASNDFSTIGITSGNNVSITDANALILGASTVSGTYNVTTSGALTQSGTLTITGLATFTAGTANDITLSTTTNNFSTVKVISGNNINIRDTNAIVLDAISASGTLTITAGNAITQTAGLSGTTLTAKTVLTGGAAITLTNPSNNFTTINLSARNTADTANAAGAISYVDADGFDISGMGTTSTLSLTASGSITQSGAISATGVDTFAAGSANDITLNNGSNDFGTVAITSGNNISMTDANALILGASTVSGTYNVSTSGAITQSGALTITGAATFAAGAANSITLSNASNDFSTVGITTGNNVSLTDTNALVLGTSTISGTFGVTTSGAITQSGTLTITGVTTLAAGSGNNITLNTGTNNFSTVAITSGNNVSFTDTNAVILGASTVSGSYDVITSGAITQSAAQTVTGTSSFTAGANAITLTTATNAFTGAVSLSNSGANNVALTNNIALSLAASSVGQNLTIITSSDAITQTGALIVPGISSFTAVANVITLTNASNSFTGAITLSNSGVNDASVTNSIATSLAASTVGGAFTITSTGGAITQTGALTITGASSFSAGSNAITLTTATNSFTGAVTLSNSGANNVSLTNNIALSLATSSVGQNLTIITSNDAVTQTGALTVLGTSSFTTGTAANTLSDSGNDFTGAITIVSGSNITLRDTNALSVGGITATGTVTLTAGDTITQSGAIAGTTLTAKTLNNLGAAITLTTATNALTTIDLSTRNAADSSTVAGAMSYRDTNAIAIANINTLSSASVIAGNVVTQTGAILASDLTVKTLNNTAANTNITLSNIGNDVTSIDLRARNAADTADVGGALTYVDATGVDITAIGTTGTLSLTTSGAITQSGAISATGVNTFSAGVGNDITLNSTNDFGTVTITSGNNVSFTDVNAVILGASTVSGTYGVTSNGAMTQSGTLTITDVATFSAGSANNITLNTSTNNFSTVSISSGNNVGLTDTNALILGASTVSGTLGVTTSGTITQSGALTVTGTTTLAAGAANDITLTNASNDFSTVAITTGNNVSLTDTNALVLAASTVSGTYDVTTNGAITQSGALAITGATTLSSGGGNNITLNNVSNNFATVSITSGNNVILYDNAALTLDTSNMSGTLTAQSTSSMTLGGNITVGGAGDALVLVGTSFNNSGLFTLTPGTGRYLIWSGSPAGDNRGGLSYNFKQYNATYNVTTVLGSGNGFLYSTVPQIVPSLTGTVSSVYDGTTTASLTGSNYQFIGAIDGDTVTLNNPTTGTYSTKNVGSNISVSVSGIAISSATNGGATVYGYSIAPTSTNALIGTITQRPLTLTINNLTKSYGENDPTYTSSVTSGSLAPGDSLTGTPARTISNINDEIVGSYIINQNTLNVNDGNGGNNYSLTVNTGILNINSTNLTVTAQNKSKIFNQPDPAFTYTTTGLVNAIVDGIPINDSASSVLTGSLSRVAGESIGQYAITQGTLALISSNYYLTYVPGILTISKNESINNVTVPAQDVFPFQLMASDTGTTASPTDAILTNLFSYSGHQTYQSILNILGISTESCVEIDSYLSICEGVE